MNDRIFSDSSAGLRPRLRGWARLAALGAGLCCAAAAAAGEIAYEGRADEESVREQAWNGAGPGVTLRLKFHVVRTERFTQAGSQQRVTDGEARIDALVNELNAIYQPAGIAFAKVPTAYHGDGLAAELLEVDSADEKRRLMDAVVSPADALNQLNVVVVPIRNLGYDGHAIFPWSRRALRQGSGILLGDEFVFPFLVEGAPGDLEPTVAAHEIGHALGLWHVERGCSGHEIDGLKEELQQVLRESPAVASGPGAGGRGDFCADTPPMTAFSDLELRYRIDGPEPDDGTYSVDYLQNPEGLAWAPGDVGNLMRTSGDRRFLSLDQAQRMHAWIDHRLRGWVVDDPGTPVEAVFTEPVFDVANDRVGIRLEWLAPQQGGHFIQRCGDPGFEAGVVTLNLAAVPIGGVVSRRGTSYRYFRADDHHGGLENGKSYWYRIGTGSNPATWHYSTRTDLRGAGALTANARPSLIPSPVVRSVPGGVLVEWDDPADFDVSGYEIRRWRVPPAPADPVVLGPVAPGTSRFASFYDRDPKAHGEQFSYQILSYYLPESGGSAIRSGNVGDGIRQGRVHPFSATPKPPPPVLSYSKLKLPGNVFRGSIAAAYQGKGPSARTGTNNPVRAILQLQRDDAGAWSDVQGGTVVLSAGQVNQRMRETGFNLETGKTYHWRVRLEEQLFDTGGSLLGTADHGWSAATSLRIPGRITRAPAKSGPPPNQTGALSYPTFTWSPVQDAAEYDVILRGPGFDNTTIRIPAGATRYTLVPPYSELHALSTYHWQVRALNDEGLGPLSGETSFTTLLRAVNLQQPAADVQLLAAVDALTVRPTFSWDGMPGEVNYRLSIRSALGGTEIYAHERQSNSLTIPEASALDAGNYVWDVTSFRRGESPTSQPNAVSATRSFSIRTKPTQAPLQVAPVDLSIDRLSRPTFIWEKRNQATDYVIEIIRDSDLNLRWRFGGETSDNLLGPGVDLVGEAVEGQPDQLKFRFPATLPGLAGARTHHWRIRARNEIAGGPWSALETPESDPVNWRNGWWEFRTGLEATGPDTPLTGSVLADQTPILRALDVPGAATYEFEVRQNTTTGPPIRSGSSVIDSRAWTVEPELPVGPVYYWRVRASGPPNGETKGEWSADATFTLRTAPNNPPTPLTPSDGQVDRLTLPNFTWSGAPQATTYEIEVVQSSSGVVKSFDGLTGTSFTLPLADRLAGARIHFWRIRGRNEVGAGPWSGTLPDYSDWTEFRTGLDPTSPAAPANGAVLQDQTPTLEAVAVSGAASYDYEVRQGSTANPIFRSGSSATNAVEWTVSPELPADAVYYWRTRASGPPNGETKSAWSGYHSFSLRTAPINPPTPLTPSAGQINRLTLPNFTWSGAPQSTTYEIQLVQNSSGVVKSFTGLTGTAFTLTAADRLAGDRLHSWRIRGRNEIGVGPWSGTAADRSDWVEFRTGLDQPAYVSPGFGSTGQSRNPLLQWQAVAGAGSYDVELWVQDSGEPDGRRLLAGRSGNSSTNSFHIDGSQLNAATLYYWRVKAVGPTTNSSFNDFWYFITHP